MAKPAGIDFNKFKKVSEDKDRTTMRSSDGHELIIAHKTLSPRLLIQLKNIPIHKAGGGSSEDDDSTQTVGQKVGYPGSTGDQDNAPKKPEVDVDTDNKTIGKIINYPGMADGGEVKKYANGTDAEPVQPTEEQQAPPTEQQEANAAPVAAAPSLTTAPLPPSTQPPVIVNVNGNGASDTTPQSTPNLGQRIGAAGREHLQQEVQTFKNAVSPIISNAKGFIQGFTGQGPTVPAQAATAATQPATNSSAAAAPTPLGPNDPYGTEAYYNAYEKGLGAQVGGLQHQAQAQSALGNMQAQVYGQNVKQLQNIQDAYAQHFNSINQETQSALTDMQQQSVDPDQFFHSQNLPQKVLTSIGLLFGGRGAAQNVMALVNNDIQSQIQNMNNKRNLVAGYMQYFGNVRDAADMAKNIQLNILANQLQQKAAQMAPSQAQAQYEQAAGQLLQAAAPIQSQIAMRRTLLQGANNSPQMAANTVRMVVPPGPQQQAAQKELETAENMNSMRDMVMSAFDKVGQLQTLQGRGFSPIQSEHQINAIMKPILGQIAHDTEGRVTVADVKLLEDMFPKLTDDTGTVVEKRQRAWQFLSSKMHFPILQSYGIHPSNWGYFQQGNEQPAIQMGAPIPPVQQPQGK